jgi:hypothetical protein
LRSQHSYSEKAIASKAYILYLLLDLLRDNMGNDDSIRSEAPSRSFSSSSQESDACSQTSKTSNSSWSLVKRETKQVNRSKVLLLGVMVTAAALLGLFTFLLVDEEEDDDFQAAVSSK